MDETTVLIGENNTGKTAVLEAVRACLERLRGRGRRQFDEYDYRLAHEGDSPTEAEPIEIQLSFVESGAAPWHDEVGRALLDVAPSGVDDLRRVRLRVTSQFDNEAGDFTTDWSFLDAEGEPLTGCGTIRQPTQHPPRVCADLLSLGFARRIETLRIEGPILALLLGRARPSG